jgi:hypothetical protein
MSAPGGVEFNQDVLVIVKHNVLVIMGHDNGDRTILRLRDRFRLDARLDVA